MMKTVEAHNAPLTGNVVINNTPTKLIDAKTQMMVDAVVKNYIQTHGIGMNEYQKLAETTAVYPEDMRIIYPTLGVCGEAGEVAEKIKKWVRDEHREMSADRLSLLKKELGDVLWYIALLARDLGLSLDDIARHNIEKLADRKDRNVVHGDGDKR